MSNKVTPYNQETEETILGHMMKSKDSIRTVIEKGVVSDDFYLAKNKQLFNIIVTMYNNKQDVDFISVSDKLKDYGHLDKIGGVDYLMNIIESTIKGQNLNSYIDILKKKSLARQIIKAGEEIASEGYDGTVDINKIIDNAEDKLRGINRHLGSGGLREGKEVFQEQYEAIEKMYKTGSSITGIRSLYTALDKMTSGFQKGDLIILAARPGMGKTAFALNLALNAANVTQGAIAIFSLEMPREQLANRMFAIRSGIPITKLRTGRLEENDWPRLSEALQTLKVQNIIIDDTPGISISELYNECRKMKYDNNLSMVIIDYISFIQTDNRSENRQQEVAEISRRLKSLARELEVPFIVLSQFSRQVERREDKRPMLADLRESGALEQDADLVLFLYRDDYYKKDTEVKNAREDVELIIAKHRNGPTGTVKLAFEREINAFYSIKNTGEE